MKILLYSVLLYSLLALDAVAMSTETLKDFERGLQSNEQSFFASHAQHTDKSIESWIRGRMESYMDIEKMLFVITDGESPGMPKPLRVCLVRDIENTLVDLLADDLKDGHDLSFNRTSTVSKIEHKLENGVQNMYAAIYVSYTVYNDDNDEDDDYTVVYYVYFAPAGHWRIYDIEGLNVKFSTYYDWLKLSDAEDKCKA